MMTAGHIAEELGPQVTEVVINYTAVDSQFYYFRQNPMIHLEFTKSKFSFEKMLQNNPAFVKLKYFPKDVTFLEPDAPADYKEHTFNAYPENEKDAKQRGLMLVELLNKRLLKESKQGGSICYLIISHSIYADEAGTILKFFEDVETNRIQPSALPKLTHEQRE